MVKDLGVKGKSNFTFRCTLTMEKAGMDIGRDDILMNFTTKGDLEMNGTKPWRGARQKDPRFFQLLIEATTDEGDVVFDVTASTGEFKKNAIVFSILN